MRKGAENIEEPDVGRNMSKSWLQYLYCYYTSRLTAVVVPSTIILKRVKKSIIRSVKSLKVPFLFEKLLLVADYWGYCMTDFC